MMTEGSNWEERMDIILQLSGKSVLKSLHDLVGAHFTLMFCVT